MKRHLLTWIMSLILSSTFAQNVDAPEKIAEYPGGICALMTFLQNTLKYPKACEMAGIEGQVVLSFVINKDGTISNLETLRSPDERLTAEAKRVVKLMPKWTPAMDKGKKVKMRYTLPITFCRNANASQQDFDKNIYDAISQQIKGKKDNPRGIYRLLRFSYENGMRDKVPHFEQYKYCSDYYTLQLQIEKDITDGANPEFWVSMLNNDKQPLNYTGYIAERDLSIYDSDSKGFKMRWHNDYMNNDYFPPNQYITELYSSEYKISPKMQRVIDLLKMKTAQPGANKFYGCWRRVGILTKVDDMDMLMSGPQDLYQIFDKDVYLHFYEVNANRMYAYCIMRPISYLSDNLLVEFDRERKVEWINDNTFKVRFDRGDGTIVTELWKRSGLPERYQQAFGTNIPVYNIPLSNNLGN